MKSPRQVQTEWEANEIDGREPQGEGLTETPQGQVVVSTSVSAHVSSDALLQHCQVAILSHSPFLRSVCFSTLHLHPLNPDKQPTSFQQYLKCSLNA